MRIYLAARYSRRLELVKYAEQLLADGHEITSRWLNGDHQTNSLDKLGEGVGLSPQAAESERVRFAQEDWQDLLRADCCISFTEAPRSSNSRGGRHVEFGAALARGQVCIVIGPRENVFHCLPAVQHFQITEWHQVREVLANHVQFEGFEPSKCLKDNSDL